MACPNCGGTTASSYEVVGAGGEVETITPEGGILVCSDCGQAVTAEEDGMTVSTEAPLESNTGAVGPRAEDLPREPGEPAPEAPPTTEQAPEETPAEEPEEEPEPGDEQ